MSDFENKLRRGLIEVAAEVEPRGHADRVTLRKAAARRRGGVVFASLGVLVILAGTVYAANSIGSDGRRRPVPAGTPICARDQVGDITTKISEPTGSGQSHFGVLFEVRIIDHEPDCEPTLYIELDDVATLPPDREGPDADEFRVGGISAESACVSSDRLSGDFLFTGWHTIGLGVGCDPDGNGPHATQQQFVFDGNSHEEVRCDVPPFRPTYLPWEQNEDGIPPTSVSEQGLVSTAVWVGSSREDIVSLSVLRFGGNESETRAPALPNGLEGFLIEHDALPDSREESASDPASSATTYEWSINWPSKSTATCRSTHLALQASALNKDEQRAELLKVAESLLEYP